MKMQKGFTLIELLVVVTIIVVLLALLVPAMDLAIERAESTLCMTNTSQLSRATALYAIDFKGRVMAVNGGRGNNWPYKLAPYLGVPSFGTSVKPFSTPIVDPGKTAATPGSGFSDGFAPATQCPSADKPGTDGYGTADTAWLNGAHGSYTMNSWVTTYGRVSGQFGHHTPDQLPKFFKKLSDATANTPLFSDGTSSVTFPESTDGFTGHDTKGDTYSGTRDGTPSFCMGLVTIDRHQWAVNVGFTDGHVEHTRLNKLWQLSWHVDYKSSDRYADLGPP